MQPTMFSFWAFQLGALRFTQLQFRADLKS